jgi:hypothetical protein
MKFVPALAVIVLSGLVGACGSDDSDPVQPGPATEVVIGEITRIDNQIPVDGGIVLDLTADNGGTDRLLFPSLFTNPPPGEAVLRLYDLVRRVEIGDRVRAEGIRTDYGVDLESLWILEGGL